MEKIIRPNIEGEMDELQRASQDLSRDEGIDVSVEDMVRAFQKSKQQTLTDEIWSRLENTESNEVGKDNWKAVYGIAKKYNKTNPEKLKKSFENGSYNRPLILNIDDRYILVAGNTRLSTASAMGINPKVFIARINNHDTMKKMETQEITGAASAGAYAAPLFSTTKKKLQETIESSGEYDVPLFGTTHKGRKNPLSIGGPDTIYKGRAVKDKKFPKWGGPNSVFIKVKEKCKKFPYCNQGDINAIEVVKEDAELMESIKIIAEKYNIPVSKVETIVLNEINKIFI